MLLSHLKTEMMLVQPRKTLTEWILTDEPFEPITVYLVQALKG